MSKTRDLQRNNLSATGRKVQIIRKYFENKVSVSQMNEKYVPNPNVIYKSHRWII